MKKFGKTIRGEAGRDLGACTHRHLVKTHRWALPIAWSSGVRAAVAHPSRGCRNAVFQTAAVALRACEHAGWVIASSREPALPQHGSIAFHPPRQRLAEEGEAGEMDLVRTCRRIQPFITRSVMTTMSQTPVDGRCPSLHCGSPSGSSRNRSPASTPRPSRLIGGPRHSGLPPRSCDDS